MYTAYITQLKNVRKHSNADRLQVGECFGNTVIVNLDYKDNDVGIYFPIDGQLGEKYCEINNLCIKKDENGNNVGGYLSPEKRNIRALKLRGEKSDGLFMPLESLSQFCDIKTLKIGDTVDTLNGEVICNKYIPKGGKKRNSQPTVQGKKKEPKDKFPYFEQHIDTAQLAYNEDAFKVGDILTISLKVHGTSARLSNTLKISKEKKTIFNWFRKLKDVKTYDVISGSRRVNLNFEKSMTDGYYGDNEFRKKWHDIITPNLRKGENLYGEIVGWVNDDKTIMNVCQNSKLGKDFVKRYGDTTTFSYGCEKGENDFYVYRMTTTNEDGFVTEYPTWYSKQRAEEMGLKFVPIIETVIFTTWKDLMDKVNELCEGPDLIDQRHVKEGVVVRIENREKFKAFKHKNYEFKCLEGIIKDVAIEPDMEEAEDV